MALTKHTRTFRWRFVLGVRDDDNKVDRQQTLISVVDDDESIRESLPDLLRVLGFASEPFDSAEAFLQSNAIRNTKCLILDIWMPGMSGPQLQHELKLRQLTMPIIFITAQSDRALGAKLLAAGAVACLLKPFGEQELLTALSDALGLTAPT
jgi:FixJ family two-component response regulator